LTAGQAGERTIGNQIRLIASRPKLRLPSGTIAACHCCEGLNLGSVSISIPIPISISILEA